MNNLRLSEILSSLSLAKDLANGNPLETSIRNAYLASFLGCTSFASDESNFLGMEISKFTFRIIGTTVGEITLTAVSNRGYFYF